MHVIATARIVAFCCLGLCGLHTAQADLPPKSQQEITALNERVSDAGRLFQQKKFLETGEVVKEVQATVEKMAHGGTPDVLEALKPIHARLAKAHAFLELEGVALPPLKPLVAEPEIPEGERVSFAGQIAPILVAKCGRCHISASRGHLSMKNFAAMMKGTPTGVIVVARDDDSKLLEVIRKGEMPKGGLAILSEEFKSLKKWVEQGAKFDGDSQRTELTELKPKAENDQ